MNAKFNASAPASKSRSAPSVARWRPKALRASALQLARQSTLAVTSPRATRHRSPKHSSWSPPPARHDRAALRRPAKAAVFEPSVARRLVQLASERSGGKNAVVQVNPSALARFNSPRPSAHGAHAGHSTHRRVVANPSLNRSANGRPPGPVWRYAVHFRQPGPGVLPLSPA